MTQNVEQYFHFRELEVDVSIHDTIFIHFYFISIDGQDHIKQHSVVSIKMVKYLFVIVMTHSPYLHGVQLAVLTQKRQKRGLQKEVVMEQLLVTTEQFINFLQKYSLYL